MRKYITKRLIAFVPTLIGVSLAIFILLRVMPGDVAALMLAGPDGEATFTQEDVDALREELGLNKPIYIQYLDWMWGLVRGDLGNSYALNKPIFGEIQRQFPVSLQLALIGFVAILIVAIPIAIIAAVKQDSWMDYILRSISILALAMPSFFVGLLVILGLSRIFNWIPPIGFAHLWDDPVRAFQMLIFPALALGFSSSGLMMRLTRTQLLEVMREDYVRTARAKGLTEQTVILKHALRNSLLPVVTIAGFQLGTLFSGTVVIEQIFNLPGIGRGLVVSLFSRDLPMIQAYIMYFAFLALVANLLVDMTYGWLDPRIRYE